ncbi:HAMP domain-containing protein, partial [Planosporangium flavigriseum]
MDQTVEFERPEHEGGRTGYGRPAGRGKRNAVTGWFADRKVNTKILLVVATMAIVAIAVGISDMTSMGKMRDVSDALYNRSVMQTANMGEIRHAYMQMRVDVTNTRNAQPGKAFEDAAAAVAASDKKVDEALTKYSSGYMVGREQAFGQLKTDLTKYRQLRDGEYFGALRAGDTETANKLRTTTFADINKALAADVDALVAIEKQRADDRYQESEAAYSSARTTLITVLVVGLLVGLALAVYVAKLIVGSVRKVSYVAEGLAAGDLTRSANVDARDELGQMAQALDSAT